MNLRRHESLFRCAECDAHITSWLTRLSHETCSLLTPSIDHLIPFHPNLVPRGYYVLSNDLPWDRIDAPEAPPQDAMVFSEEDADGLSIDTTHELDQYGGWISGIYGPNMSCKCGRRIATCVRDAFSVGYVYVPLANLRYRTHLIIQESNLPRLNAANIDFSGEDAGYLILVVDGNGRRRSERRKFLERFGYRIIEAENGLEGVAAAVQEHPELILMNHLLADMNGMEATKLIRHQSIEQNIIPMDPASDEEELRREAWDAGCGAYLQEPCFKLELLELVKRYTFLFRKSQSDANISR